MRAFDLESFAAAGLVTKWQQESLSFNKAVDTIRGLHFQTPPHIETKIVRVMQGAIIDVFVDLRKGSSTFGKWDAIELSADNGVAVYIPAGFAHGFRTLATDTLIEYKIDVPYSAENADGLLWNDKTLKIDWGVDDPLISDRDDQLPPFGSFISPF